MKQITWKHAVAGLVLLAILSLVAPAPAQAAVWGAGARGDAGSDGWSWMSSLWNELVMMFGGGARVPQAPAATKPHGPAVEKSGTGSSGTTATGDSGADINPDGQPPV
jgi:hypothetical protein